jgi:hypothetical protein
MLFQDSQRLMVDFCGLVVFGAELQIDPLLPEPLVAADADIVVADPGNPQPRLGARFGVLAKSSKNT